MEVLRDPERADWKRILTRPGQDASSLREIVEAVFLEVQRHGDQAVMKFTEKYDGIRQEHLLVSEEEFARANANVDEKLKKAIIAAKLNIERFHLSQQTAVVHVETVPGVDCWQEKKAIEKVGLYIPGGTAPLFSTVLMLGIPAQIAGCEDIVLCTPPSGDGSIHPAILYTAKLCGIHSVYKAGGAQAIAAMTFGTNTIPAVYKIFGPGNQYVTAAKQRAALQGVAIDMPAGPSELLVLADASADASFIAADLISQAEHGPDSQVILVTTCPELPDLVAAEVERQMTTLPRKSIAGRAIENSKLIYIQEVSKAMELVNEYAPEHLIIVSEEESYYLRHLRNAGSVFLGSYSPESAGDYASGTNHTLPTNGYARQYSGVNLDSFMKSITFQRITKSGLRHIGPTVEIMAAAEGLSGHKNAVTIRLKRLQAEGRD